MSCPFCDIETLRSRLIEERPRVFVAFSDPRLMPGHLLVIPKRHVEHLAELNEEERADLFEMAVEYQSRIIGRLGEGCDLRQHDRPFLPQSKYKIDHIHIHLLPREPFDELYQASRGETDLFMGTADEECAAVLDRLAVS